MGKSLAKFHKVFICIFLLACFTLQAQDSIYKPTNRATMLGIGGSKLVDTYLSPLMYNGLSMSVLHDRIAPTRFMQQKLVLQQQFQLQTAWSKNPSGTASTLLGEISYNANALYPILENRPLHILAGGGLDASLGGLYNSRNSNNPASLKTSINLQISVMAVYNWNRCTFRWQLGAPFLGVFFSPHYGQSYYEIFSLDNTSDVVKLASLHNFLAWKNYFTVDVHLKKITFRIGYLGDYGKTKVNNLETKINTHQFMIGLATETLRFGGLKARNNKQLQSSFY